MRSPLLVSQYRALIYQGAAQKMAQLTQILTEKDEQLSKMRNATETESAAKSRELEEIAKRIPGYNLILYASFISSKTME